MRTTSHIAWDLRAVLQQRGAVAGNTWGSFKEAMAALGVKDDMLLASIEYGVAQDGSGRIVAEVDPDLGELEVREVSR